MTLVRHPRPPETARAMTESATIYNRPAAARSPIAAEPAVKDVLVVGGGTAGWMAALMLSNSAFGPRIRVTLLESAQVGAIGVGEGSTPWLRGFFEELDIEESEWMPACNATYKSGITFAGWSTRPGCEQYFHSFASMLDNLTMPAFVEHVHARLNDADLHAHPDRFFISRRLARGAQAPRPQRHFPFDVWYGYHFDSVRLGRFLHGKALERGVRHVEGHVTSVRQGPDGEIQAVQLEDGRTLQADLFIDCTGFASLLIGKALKTPYASYADSLFNDAAVALPTPIEGPIESQTVSTALRHGWTWKIPLTNRFGHGYVYSSAYCSADQAETELRTHLGLLESDTPARHLKMRVGRVERHWNRNCVAVGLSQGFIEPLEATALMLVQRTVERLVRSLEKGELDEAARGRFNEAVNAQFDHTRDYIVAHYKTNTRIDTDYWRDNAANTHLSTPLRHLLQAWLARKPLIPGLNDGTFGRGYPIVSWYSLLAGMGVFPDARELRPPTADEAIHDLARIDNLIERSAMNFPDHRAFLQDIPARSREPSLQVYFW